MVWHGIRGHDEIVARFRRALVQHRLGGTYLFLGPPGVGKRMFALKLAQALLCENRATHELDPCGLCGPCLQVSAGSHPDLLIINKPPERAYIPLELLIGERGQTGAEAGGLISFLALRSYRGQWRIAVIDDADYFNADGANALLKTLEEPPPQSLLILIGTSASRQLPTIRSRSQMVRFLPLGVADLTDLILEEGLAPSRAEAEKLALVSEGSLARARELADPELWPFINEWRNALVRQDFDVLVWTQRIRDFVEQAGTEAAFRRRRLQQLFSLTLQTLRDSLADAVGLPQAGAVNELENELQAAAMLAGRWPSELREDILRRCLEHTLFMHEQVDRNINPNVLIDDWVLGLWQRLNEMA